MNSCEGLIFRNCDYGRAHAERRRLAGKVGGNESAKVEPKRSLVCHVTVT